MIILSIVIEIEIQQAKQFFLIVIVDKIVLDLK